MINSPENNISLEDLDNAPFNITARSHVTIEQWRESFLQVSDKNFALKEENHRIKLQLQTKDTLDNMLTPYADRAYVFMCSYCGAVGFLLLLNGFKNSGFVLPGSVLNFLVGSTAVTVISLVATVLMGIFIGARPK